MSSNWCDTTRWYTDQKLTQQSNAIPLNEIDDVQIEAAQYTYSIVDSTCFGRIPFLKCNNLNIVLATGSIIGNIGATFSCANLAADNVTIGIQNILCQHWNTKEFCNWDISTLTTSQNHKNTALAQIIILNLNSGSLDHTVIDQSYIKSNILGLNNCSVIGTDDIRTYISCSSGSIVDTQTNNDNAYWEGNFKISGTTIEDTILRGSGQGTFDFIRSKNYAALGGDLKFGYAAKNYGKLYGNPIFSGGSQNFGIILGDCIFSGANSSNYGTISGTSIFIDGASNRGNITKPAIFYSGTYNYGNLKDFSTFYYAYNYGKLSNGSKFIYSNNYGLIPSGDVIFISGSNHAVLQTLGSISFNEGCNNYNSITNPSGQISFNFYSVHVQGHIAGSATFGTKCINSGTVKKSIFTSSSENRGIILDVGIFQESSINSGTVPTGLFYDSSMNGGSIDSIAKFYQASTNDYDMPIGSTGMFYDSSSNHRSIRYGLFYNNTINSGTEAKILQTGIFHDSAQNYGFGGDMFFYDKSRNNFTVNSGIFLSNSINASEAIITTAASFSGNSINYGNIFINQNNFVYAFNDNSINNGKITSTSIATFSGSSVNKNYVRNANLYANARNHNLGSGYNLNFFNKSTNNGYVSNIGLFYDESINLNLGVVVNATFYNRSTNNSSMRRTLVSGYEPLTSGTRTIQITDQAKNQGSLNNVAATFKISGINEGSLQWVFNSLLIYTSSGIYNTGTTPYSYVSTGTFLINYSGANIPSLEFGDDSINRSSINGYSSVLFKDSSVNYASIVTYPPVPKDHLSATFIGSTNNGPIQNKAQFSNGAINYGALILANFSNSINSGEISDSGSFTNNSLNIGNVNITLFDSSVNSGTVNTGMFLGTSFNYNRINNGSFFGLSTNSGIISNSSEFWNNSKNISTTTIPLLTFNNNSINEGKVTEGYFYDQASNANSGVVLGMGTFSNGGINDGTVNGTAVFIINSINRGNINGDAVFNNSSCTSGILQSSAFFTNNSSCSNTIIYGSAIFNSGSCYDKNTTTIYGTITKETGCNPEPS